MQEIFLTTGLHGLISNSDLHQRLFYESGTLTFRFTAILITMTSSNQLNFFLLLFSFYVIFTCLLNFSNFFVFLFSLTLEKQYFLRVVVLIKLNCVDFRPFHADLYIQFIIRA